MSSASERVRVAIRATSACESRIAQRSHRSGAHRRGNPAHHVLPAAVKGALRDLVGDMCRCYTVGVDVLALQAARQLKPFGAFDAKAVAATVEHFDIVGRASAGGTVKRLM